MPVPAGTRLGPYEVVARLDAGGQGEVYEGRDLRLERQIAIKILPEPFAHDPAALARFEREARSLAALRHSNILAIHDIGTESGTTFIVTELLAGENLAKRIQRGPLPWRDAVEIGISIAQGLAAAHGCGVVHRDLKPANVFLLPDGQLKILDFGLAKRETGEPLVNANGEAFSTESGVLVGTPGYISPEQIRWKAADERSDLFALGCILYEMVTGQRAFSGETAPEAIVAALKQEPKDPADLADVPEDIRMIILCCLAKKPEARFQTARDLAIALKAARALERPKPRPPSTPDAPTIVTDDRSRRRKRRRLLLIAAAVGVTAAAAWFLLMPPGRIDSLAILPFANATGDPKVDYVSDGLAEGVIHGLSRLPEVRVLAWTTVVQMKGRDPLKAARELGVKAMLTGRILSRDGGLVSETELVDVRHGTRLWGDRTPRRLPDASAAEEIVREVSTYLHAKLPPESRPGAARYGARDPEAYDLYLKGRYLWNKRSPEGIEKSIALYEQAIAKDPYFALAFAGLADSYDLLAFYGALPPRDALPRARDAAIRALELDPAIAEAQASLADALYQFDWDFPAAEQRFKKATALNANYATGHQWYSNFLSVSKRFEQSFEEIELARRLDPLNLMISTDVGLARYWAGDYERSITSLKQTLELEPNFYLTHVYLGMALARMQLLEGAIAEAQAARRLEPADPTPIMVWGYASGRAGRREEAYRALSELRALSEKRFVSAFTIAAVYVGLAEKDKALEWLEKAYVERDGRLVYLGIERAFDPFRSDPRFQDLVRRIRLPA